MKSKLEMAHEYALEMLKRGDPEWRIATDAWKLVDAMLDEFESKQDKSRHKVVADYQDDFLD